MPPSLFKGQKFGMLTVDHWVGSKKAWYCLCDCGGETHARSFSLKNGKHSRCACCQTAPRPHRYLPDDMGPKNQYFRHYRKAAEKRDYCFDLSLNEFIEIVHKSCHYCGDSPKPNAIHPRLHKILVNGIDRVDNSIGYTVDNCVPCCSICNKAKASLSLETWMIWIRRVHAHTMSQTFSKIKVDIKAKKG